MLNQWRFRHESLVDSAGRHRRITVCLPPSISEQTKIVYCTDGQVVEALAQEFSRSGVAEWPVFVGVHSSETVRAQEYLFSLAPEYLHHERFFTEELRAWSRNLELEPSRNRSVVFGFSNGGAFALTTALRNPHCYDAALSFSTPRLPMLPPIPPAEGPRPHIYFAVGKIGPEKSIRKNTLRLARWLRKSGIAVTVSERQAGHTLNFWAAELVVAMRQLKTAGNA